MALGPTHPPIQWVPGALSLGVKRPGREADHLPPSSVEVKNAWSYNSTPQCVFMVWCLVKHKDNFTFYLCYFHCILKKSILWEGKGGDLAWKVTTLWFRRDFTQHNPPFNPKYGTVTPNFVRSPFVYTLVSSRVPSYDMLTLWCVLIRWCEYTKGACCREPTQ
jgi:hypothetical protein